MVYAMLMERKMDLPSMQRVVAALFPALMEYEKKVKMRLEKLIRLGCLSCLMKQ